MKGWFRTSREPTKGGTHLRVVALTAYEVASAMAYIHSHGIAHLVRTVMGLQHVVVGLRILVGAEQSGLLAFGAPPSVFV